MGGWVGGRREKRKRQRDLYHPPTHPPTHSNQTGVASRLALPDTHFLLDYVRPDMLLLRVVARALVLWDR